MDNASFLRLERIARYPLRTELLSHEVSVSMSIESRVCHSLQKLTGMRHSHAQSYYACNISCSRYYNIRMNNILSCFYQASMTI